MAADQAARFGEVALGAVLSSAAGALQATAARWASHCPSSAACCTTPSAASCRCRQARGCRASHSLPPTAPLPLPLALRATADGPSGAAVQIVIGANKEAIISEKHCTARLNQTAVVGYSGACLVAVACVRVARAQAAAALYMLAGWAPTNAELETAGSNSSPPVAHRRRPAAPLALSALPPPPAFAFTHPNLS